MFCRAELRTVIRTLIACFPRRAKESHRTSHHTQNAPHLGYLRLPAKDESSNNGVSKHRDAALYNKSTLFPSKGEGISTFFFKNRFHNDKWIDTCQVSQEVSSHPSDRPVPQLGPPFCLAVLALPLLRCLSSLLCGVSISRHLRGPRSRLWGHMRAMSDFTTFSWIHKTTIKKQILKEATCYHILCIKTFNTKLYMCWRQEKLVTVQHCVHISSSFQAG